MREKDIRELIGSSNWHQFTYWMTGQTVGVYPDGEIDYYDCDVESFKTKMDTGYDRQNDSMGWD